MHTFYAIMVSLLLSSSATEWVEISQRPKPGVDLIHSTSSIKLVKKNEVPAVYQDAVEISSMEMTPSPHWVQYQRERYRNQSAQGLIVSTGQHLKTSAQIVVPASISSTVASVLRNQIFHTKTRLDVVATDKKPHNSHVETTSRREISDFNVPVNEEETEYEDADVDTEDAEQQEPQEPTELQMPSINGFFKFLKSVQSAWWKKTGLSFENKILTLKKLRDNLMRVIEKQLSIIWLPERTSEGRRRLRRGLLDESSLNFPPEAALMSINFLTFAVFLIKLVLQVVHIVKSKHYSFSGLNVNAEPAGKVHAI